MIVTLWHVTCISTVFPVGVVVCKLGKEETAEQGELRWVHRFFIDHRLACLEEVVVVWPEYVLIQWDATSSCHCMINMEPVGIGHFLVILV